VTDNRSQDIQWLSADGNQSSLGGKKVSRTVNTTLEFKLRHRAAQGTGIAGMESSHIKTGMLKLGEQSARAAACDGRLRCHPSPVRKTLFNVQDDFSQLVDMASIS
jgi:hypothetical protein